MRNLKTYLFGILICSLLGAPLVSAADPLEVAPELYKLKFENERVRVMEVTFQPGDKIATHSHPDHLNYIVSGGKLRLSYEDGTSKEIAAETGQVIWIPAETHAGENIGDTEVRILVVELK